MFLDSFIRPHDMVVYIIFFSVGVDGQLVKLQRYISRDA